MKPNILALDPATKTGWAHSCGASGVWDLTPKKGEPPEARLLKLWRNLLYIREEYGIDLINYEDPRNLRHGNAVRVLGRLMGVIELFCGLKEIPCNGYSPTAIKKWATGKGTASKEDMIEAAKARCSMSLSLGPDGMKLEAREIIDDNHADALLLLAFYQSEVDSFAPRDE